MEFVNLTPHTINEVVTGLAIPPSGQVARVATEMVAAGTIGGVPTFVARTGDVEGIPTPREGVVFVVSGMVLAATDRDDVVAPGELVRNDQGQPTGCMGFKRN